MSSTESPERDPNDEDLDEPAAEEGLTLDEGDDALEDDDVEYDDDDLEDDDEDDDDLPEVSE